MQKNTTKNLPRIGILGAGPAGLMTALALEAYLPPHAGEITILDRNASETDYPGVEYGIQERACRALERIGKLEQALVRGNPCTEVAFFNSRLGKRFRSILPNPKYTRSVVRQEFLADLAGLLQHTSLKRRHLVTSLSEAEDRSVTLLGTAGKDAEPFEESFDLVVAADGIHSVARKALFLTETEIFDRGFSCIYMLVEGTDETAPNGFMDFANSGRSELIMGNYSTMTLFPLGNGRLAFGIGFDHATKAWLFQEHGLAPDAEWPKLSPEIKKAIAVRLTEDARIYEGMLVKALDLIPDWNSYKIYLWAMRDANPLQTPWSNKSNVIVIGDAAHAIMPTIGMGASLAIEDGEALAAGIATVVSRTKSREGFRREIPHHVFKPFTGARHTVWVNLIQRSRRAAIGNFIQVNKRKRFAIGPQIPNDTLSKLVMAAEWFIEKVGL
jgi:salicylate hydroxylase